MSSAIRFGIDRLIDEPQLRPPWRPARRPERIRLR